MTTRRTEPIIKKERVAVYVSLGLAFAAIAAIVPVMSTTAYAAQPVDANCWGDVTQDFAQKKMNNRELESTHLTPHLQVMIQHA